MGNDVEYILRIILRARDELTGKLAKARAEIAAFSKDADRLSTSLGKLNTQMTSLNTRTGNATDKIKAWRAAMQSFGGETDKSAKNIDKVVKNTDRLVVSERKAVTTHKDSAAATKVLQERYDGLIDRYVKLNERAKIQGRDNQYLVFGYREIAKELDNLAKKAGIGEELSQDIHGFAESVRGAQQDITDSTKGGIDKRREIYRKENISREGLLAELLVTLQQREKTADENITKIHQAEAADRTRITKNEIESNLAAEKQLTADLRKERVSRKGLLAQLLKTLQDDEKRVQADVTEINKSEAADRIRVTKSEVDARIAAEKQLEIETKKAARSTAADKKSALAEAARAVRDADKEEQAFARSIRNTTRDSDRQSGSLRRLGGGFDRTGNSVAGFDNQLRGLGLLVAFGFAQQLITVLIGLGGQLVAVAASAGMAGAALGGILVAGIAQGLPVLGLFIGAMSRVKAVINAVQQATKLQQAQSKANFESQRKEADGADAIANANDTLTSALQGVGDAQDSLAQAQRQSRLAQEGVTTARRDAVRQLHDMIVAEEDAKRAASDAVLSQKDAQKALEEAIRAGDDLAVQHAQSQLDAAKANVQRTRVESGRQTADTGRAVAGGVEGIPGLQQAKRAADDANRSVQQAQQGIQNAERAVTRATRGVETARRNAAEAVAGTQSAAATLNFLLSQLSPAERTLFEAIRRIQHTWKTAWTGAGGILEPIIESFASSVDRINTIMQMPSVLKTARGLSGEIAKQFGSLTKAFTSTEMIGQFKKIADQAKGNLKPITDIATGIGTAFANIAVDAGPAFKDFLGFVKDLVDKFVDLTGHHDKVQKFFSLAEQHLESWLNLVGAVVGFFAAITGAGGAEEGKKGIDDLTESLNGITDWVNANKGKVHDFFRDARRVTDQVVSVVVNLAKELFKAFDPKHTQNFANLINRVVIPALGLLITTVGSVANLVTSIFGSQGISDVAKFGLAFAAFGFTASKVEGAFKLLSKGIKEPFEVLGRFGNRFQKAGDALIQFGGKQKDITLLQEGGLATTGKFSGVLAKLGPIATKAGTLIRAASAFAFGPWGLAIAAVITAIILLDRKFHFLAPTFKWLKGAFGDVIDWLKTHWPLVLTILTGPFGLVVTIIAKNWDKIKHGFRAAFGAIKDVLHDIADFIGGRSGGPIGRALSSVLRFIVKWSPVGVLLRVGKEMWKGLKSGFVDSILDFFANIGKWLFNHVIKPIYEFFEIKSPSGLFKRIGMMLVDGFVEGFKSLPGALLGLLGSIGNKLLDVGKKIGEWIVKGLEKIPGGKLILGAAGKVSGFLGKVFAQGGPVPGSGKGDVVPAMLEPGEHVLTKGEVAAAGGHAAIFAFRSALGGGGQGFGGRFQAGGIAGHMQLAQNNPQGFWVAKQTQLNLEKAGNRDIEKESVRTEDVRVKQLQKMWEDVKTITRRGANYVEAQWRDMRVNTTNTTKRMLGDTVDAWTKTWQQLDKLAYEGLFYIGHESNLALTAFGGKAIDFHLSAPHIEKRAEGGFMVPGSGSGDKIPALLEPGEFVFNKVATSKIGRSVLEFLNFQGIPRFAKGGYTGPGHSGAGFTPVWNFAKSNFGMSYFTGFDGHNMMTSSNNISDHFVHRALDMGNGVLTAGEDALNQFFKTKVPQVVKQLIWRSVDQLRGYLIGDHEDHVHLAMPDQYAFDGPLMAKILSRAKRGLSISELLSSAGTDEMGMPLIDHVDHIPVKGPKGPFKSMIQRIFNLVRRLGNKHLDDTAGVLGSGTPGLEVPVSHYDGSLNALFPRHTLSNTGGHVRLSTKQVQDVAAGAGLNKVVFEKISRGESSNYPGIVQVDPGDGNVGWGLWQLTPHAWGPGSIAMQALNSLGGIGQMLNPVKNARMAKFLLDHAQSQVPNTPGFPWFGTRFLSRGGLIPGFAQGGIVPGSGGTPVPIIAHANEWILNRLQQSKLAQMLGLSTEGLKGMLGFHGNPRNAQGGLFVQEPRVVQGGPIDTSSLKQLVAIIKALVNIKIPDLGDPLRTTTALFEDIGNVFGRMTELGKLAANTKDKVGRNKAVRGFLDAIDKITGDGGLLDRVRTSVDRRATLAARRLLLGRFAIGSGRVVTSSLSATQVAERSLEDVRGQRGDILSERDLISEQLKAVNAQQRRKGLSTKVKERLAAQEAGLRTRLDDAQQRIADNVQAIFDAQQALLEARIADQQEAVDNITKSADRQSAFLDFSRRVATVFGNKGALAQINAAQRDILADEANKLEARIGEARAAGAGDLADQLEVQVADLRTQIVESLASELADAAQQIQDAGQKRGARLDLFSRLLAATGTVGQTAAVSLGGESFSTSGLAQAQQTNTLNSIAKTQDLLDRVQREQPENAQLIQDLTDSLLELNVTVQEQARAAFVARIDDVNTRSEFTLSINDLNKQVLDLQGQIAGQADQAGLLRLAQERQGILTQKGNELQALYNEAIAKRDQQAMQDLEKAILENQVAVLQNTVTINELAGVMKDPQSFTSSAWSIFREAIFSGMGQVLPQFSFPMAATGGVVAKTGLMQLHAGELIKSSGTWSDKPGGGDTFNIYEAGRPIDTTELTGAIAFARKSHQ